MKKAKNSITKRELEILELLSNGYSSREIAEMLFISINTVEYHRRLLIKKTESRNVAHLIGKGFRMGLLKTTV